ncbi:MAG: hypothetical protein R2700_15925 [Solirubrobacterales bacterium]
MISSAVIVALGAGDGHGVADDARIARIGHLPLPALIPVLDRPIVARAIEDLAGLGIKRMAVLVDAVSGDRVAAALAADGDHGAEIELVRCDPGSTLGEAVAATRPHGVGEPFVLHFGGCLGRSGLGDHLGSLRLRRFDAVALTSRFDRVEDEAATAAPPAQRPAISEFHVGVFALGAGFPAALPQSAAGSASWMEGALAWMEGQGGEIDRRFVTGWWRQGPGRPGILAANRFALSGIEPEAGAGERGWASGSDIEGPLTADPTAEIDSSVIRGPVHIAAGARIADSFVGPFTTIGPDVVIEGAEIENSVVLEGSRISHVDGRLDSSVIGPHATVGRDFRIPRGTRLEVGPGAHVMLD